MIDIRCADEKVRGMGTSQGAMAAGYVVVAGRDWSRGLLQKAVLICRFNLGAVR